MYAFATEHSTHCCMRRPARELTFLLSKHAKYGALTHPITRFREDSGTAPLSVHLCMQWKALNSEHTFKCSLLNRGVAWDGDYIAVLTREF
jgi:hypothetical protein